MADDEPRGRGARSAVKAAGHKASGGHSPQTLRNRVIHDPNAPDEPHHHERRHMAYIPYPKWLHFDGEPSVLVKDEAEREAHMASRVVPEKRGPGRPKKVLPDKVYDTYPGDNPYPPAEDGSDAD